MKNKGKFADNNISVSFKKGKKRLTILKNGIPVGGFAGSIANRMADKLEIKEDAKF